MRLILHILTKPDDALAQDQISRQIQLPDLKVEVVNLAQPEPDYAVLVARIFAADSVQVW